MFYFLDLELFKVTNLFEKSEENRISSRKIRQNVHSINTELVKETKPDLEKRDQLLKLLKKMNYIHEDDQNTRIKKAKLFMEKREQSLKDNGLLWSLNQEHGDRNKILSLEYQVL